MTKQITIKEIAELAKVSPGTVDRVLHNRGEVSQKTKKKILKIISDGNYTPNIFARNLVLNKTYIIASILPKYKADDYWESPSKGVEQAVRELKMLGIQNRMYFFQQDNAAEFEEIALQALKENPDGILLAPVMYEKAMSFSELCAKRNIPVIVIDSDIPEAEKLSFIGQNAFKSGYLAAKLLDITSRNNKIYIISIITTGDNNANFKQRKLGFTSYYNSLAEPIEIITIDLHMEDSDFDNHMAGLVKELEHGDKLFVPNSRVHLLAKVINGHKKSADVRLIGYDLLQHNKVYLENETIDFLINQKPEQQGYLAMQHFYKFLVVKQEVQKNIYMPLEIVTKENLEFIHY